MMDCQQARTAVSRPPPLELHLRDMTQCIIHNGQSQRHPLQSVSISHKCMPTEAQPLPLASSGGCSACSAGAGHCSLQHRGGQSGGAAGSHVQSRPNSMAFQQQLRCMSPCQRAEGIVSDYVFRSVNAEVSLHASDALSSMHGQH